MNMSKIAQHLGLSEEELALMGLNQDSISPVKGPDGEAKLGYYFTVPEQTPDKILGKKQWSIGERVEIDATVIEDAAS